MKTLRPKAGAFLFLRQQSNYKIDFSINSLERSVPLNMSIRMILNMFNASVSNFNFS
jgi:hypothetical protein